MYLSEAASATSGNLSGKDVRIRAINIDTRKAKAGELFVALRGPNFNGHEFIDQALERQLGAAMIDQPVSSSLPTLRVSDTHQALKMMAAYWRNKFQIPIIAITGSNGKTTTREMVGAIMGSALSGLMTRGNLNNDIGVPFTLLRLRHSDRYAVIEMGMNHRGEIAALSKMTRPDVALITNVAEAHLQGVGSIQQVAAAKVEIVEGLQTQGIMVINRDDEFYNYWSTQAAHLRQLSFGLSDSAEIWAEYELYEDRSRLLLHSPAGDCRIELALAGRHNVVNACAAAAASLAAGASLEMIAAGLSSIKDYPGRLTIHAGINNSRVIDDSYNANPGSLRAATDVLAAYDGYRIMVIADMGELGSEAEELHRKAGQYLKQKGIDRLLTLGPLSRSATHQLGEQARSFDDHQALTNYLRTLLTPDATVLVKGSRAMQMEQVVQEITQANNENGVT